MYGQDIEMVTKQKQQSPVPEYNYLIWLFSHIVVTPMFRFAMPTWRYLEESSERRRVRQCLILALVAMTGFCHFHSAGEYLWRACWLVFNLLLTVASVFPGARLWLAAHSVLYWRAPMATHFRKEYCHRSWESLGSSWEADGWYKDLHWY